MTNYPTDAEAQVALHGIDRARRQVIDQIGMPTWYWWGLALGWIGLGVLSDLGNPWLVTAGTLTFGAVHAYVSQRVLAGRRRRGDVTVRADVVGRRVVALVIGCLFGLVGITIAAALLLNADGAEHPVTIASVFVAVMILLGGPRLMDAIRANALRRAAVA
jgi:hypothetical protein